MNQFEAHEYVDITIPRARVIKVDCPGDDVFLSVVYGENNHLATIRIEDAITITRVAPAEWPPRPGDLWRDREGELWFTARHWPDYDDPKDSKGVNAEGWRPVMVPVHLGEQGSPWRPEDVLQPAGPFTLVHREADAEDGA